MMSAVMAVFCVRGGAHGACFSARAPRGRRARARTPRRYDDGVSSFLAAAWRRDGGGIGRALA